MRSFSKAKNTRNRIIIELMARGGMRISEVLKLTASDIEDRKLIIRDAKSGKAIEHVFIPQKIADRLKQYIREKGLSPDADFSDLFFLTPLNNRVILHVNHQYTCYLLKDRKMYKRNLRLPEKPKQSFFLWGTRQTGKTTLLKACYPDALRIDLLKTDELMRYAKEPSLLREEVAALSPERLIVVDEIQKAPVLLDEIHYMIQEWQRVFALCGSSARKVRRGHANLLGGRAIRYELFGLVAQELGDDFSIAHFVNTGPLPDHYGAENPALALRAYVDDYLREEILQESLTRSLPIFSDFLRVAAIGDTEILNMSNIARETGISVSTVRDHYGILVDTLMGAFLPAFTLRPKRRTIQAPKFYFRDLGVVNHLARRGAIKHGSELFGKAFENWLFHELSVHTKYSELFYELSYWRLSSGIEVDFILGPGTVAIEAKGKSKITSGDIRGLINFKKDFPEVKRLIIVCLEKRMRKTDEGIHVVPYQEFTKLLWDGKLTQGLYR